MSVITAVKSGLEVSSWEFPQVWIQEGVYAFKNCCNRGFWGGGACKAGFLGDSINLDWGVPLSPEVGVPVSLDCRGVCEFGCLGGLVTGFGSCCTRGFLGGPVIQYLGVSASLGCWGILQVWIWASCKSRLLRGLVSLDCCGVL